MLIKIDRISKKVIIIKYLQNYELELQQTSTLNSSVLTLNFLMSYHVLALLRVLSYSVPTQQILMTK